MNAARSLQERAQGHAYLWLLACGGARNRGRSRHNLKPPFLAA